MKSLHVVALLALCACAASTAAHAGRADTEASMLLTGRVTVSPQGAVQTYAIDTSGKVPPVVMSLLARTIPRWHFRAVMRDGHPVATKASMALRVVAQPGDQGDYLIRVASASFRDRDAASTDSVHVVRPGAIFYPGILARDGVAGIAYVIVRIDRQGHVTNAVTAQVDLRVRGPARGMQHWRTLFAQSAVAFARRTTYAIPTTGPQAARDHWVFCIPVYYDMDAPGKREPEYGQWVDYVPGPRARIPWLDADERRAAASDAVPAGSVNMLGGGLKRLKPAGS